MNKGQLINHVIIPTLNEIPKGFSSEAVLAVIMIIAHESKRGEFIHQVGGPALGLIQMEPATHDDTWKHADSIWRNAELLGIITHDEHVNDIHPPAERLTYDLRYNVFMARQRLFMKPGKLPITSDTMSEYLKIHWNSINGSANFDSYMVDYGLWN